MPTAGWEALVSHQACVGWKVCQRYLSLEELLFPTTFRGSLRVWRLQQHFQETLGAHMQLWEMSQTVWSQSSATGVR